MTKLKLKIAFLLLGFISCFSTSFAQTNAKINITPNALYERMINSPQVKNGKGEGFCWHARSGMDQYINNYLVTNDTEWLDAGVRYFDYLISKLDTDPDGYRGWIGPYMYDDKYWIDSHVGDAILVNGLLDFSLLVMENKDLQKKYQAKADEFVALAKRDLVEKCDFRGTWKVDGNVGGYISFEKYMEPGNTKEWKYGSEVIKSGMSHPFNKQMDMGQICLQLYRLTGDKKYRDIAEKIYLRTKRQLQLVDDHYEWNYWEPYGPWDIDWAKKAPRHWVGINPSAGYQSREVAQMVEAYHHGIVFDKTDISRLINTHLKVMWNKDSEKPAFTNSNVRHKPDQRGTEKKATGTLWTSLLGFDQTIRDLYETRFKEGSENSAEYLHYKKNIASKPVSFKRKYAKGNVKVPKVNFSNCGEIRQAAVVPGVFAKGDKVALVNYTWKSGDLEVAVYSANGKKKIAEIFKGKRPADNLIEWDGTDPAKKVNLMGDYRVRWTVGNEYREFPVNIK